MSRLRLALAAVAAVACLSPAAAQAQLKSCKNGSIVAGDPLYKRTGTEQIPPSGSGLRDDPPLFWRTLAFAGDNLYTDTGQEVWVADLKTGKLSRVAGEEQKGLPRFGAGPCSQARFANIHGIAALSDGTLVVADHDANALLSISQPNDPGRCTVAYLAGTKKPSDAARDLPRGDKDGPGADALLAEPEWPVADAAGNVYFVDGGALKVKKLAADAAHTVTTVAPLPKEGGIQSYRGMTMLKGKLYALTNNFTFGFVFEIDPASGAVKKTLAADGKSLAEIGPNMVVAFSSITNDGKDLFVSGSGFVWRLTTGGKVSLLAGAGSPLEYPTGYDPKVTHPAKQLILRYRVGDQGPMGTNTAMAVKDGALYWRGRNESPFVLKIDCK